MQLAGTLFTSMIVTLRDADSLLRRNDRGSTTSVQQPVATTVFVKQPVCTNATILRLQVIGQIIANDLLRVICDRLQNRPINLLMQVLSHNEMESEIVILGARNSNCT